MTQSDDERHRPARDHLRDVGNPREVDDELVEIFESHLIRGLGQSVLRIRHEGREGPLQVADLIDGLDQRAAGR